MHFTLKPTDVTTTTMYNGSRVIEKLSQSITNDDDDNLMSCFIQQERKYRNQLKVRTAVSHAQFFFSLASEYH
jgi:hypothetical protein